VDEINGIAAYQWWEGAIYILVSVLAYPLAWSWQQWRRRIKLQRLREFVRSEYDHACLRSCRSRALYEGLKVCLCGDFLLPIHTSHFFYSFSLQNVHAMWLTFGSISFKFCCTYIKSLAIYCYCTFLFEYYFK